MKEETNETNERKSIINKSLNYTQDTENSLSDLAQTKTEIDKFIDFVVGKIDCCIYNNKYLFKFHHLFHINEVMFYTDLYLEYLNDDPIVEFSLDETSKIILDESINFGAGISLMKEKIDKLNKKLNHLSIKIREKYFYYERYLLFLTILISLLDLFWVLITILVILSFFLWPACLFFLIIYVFFRVFFKSKLSFYKKEMNEKQNYFKIHLNLLDKINSKFALYVGCHNDIKELYDAIYANINNLNKCDPIKDQQKAKDICLQNIELIKNVKSYIQKYNDFDALIFELVL